MDKSEHITSESHCDVEYCAASESGTIHTVSINTKFTFEYGANVTTKDTAA